MWQRQDFSLPAGHPSAVGHFPGDPIIPGALLLDAMVVAIQTAKFLRPARFGQPLQLRWQAQGGGQFRFECRHGPDESMVLAGMLAVSGTAA